MWITELAAEETDAVLDSLDPDKDWPTGKGVGANIVPEFKGIWAENPDFMNYFGQKTPMLV